MKHQIRMTFEDLCHNFKDFPHLLEYTLKEWTINVEITLYYEFYRTRVVEVNNLDDVVQCILKYGCWRVYDTYLEVTYSEVIDFN